MQSKHKQTKCEHSRRNSYRLQRKKGDIEFVTEFPCLFGHPVDIIDNIIVTDIGRAQFPTFQVSNCTSFHFNLIVTLSVILSKLPCKVGIIKFKRYPWNFSLIKISSSCFDLIVSPLLLLSRKCAYLFWRETANWKCTVFNSYLIRQRF